MIQIENVSRRGFLKGVLGTSAFVLGARFLPGTLPAASGAVLTDPMSSAALQPNVYLAIATDNTIYIVAARAEMGSGNRTGLPMIVADELDADWNRVTVIQGTGNEKYGDQDTDGSHSVKSFFDTLRESGASARVMLVGAAAQSVESSGKRVQNGIEFCHPQAQRKEVELRRTGFGGGQVAGSEKRRSQAERPKGLELYRQADSRL